MRHSLPFRSLLSQFTFRVILPLSLVIFGVIATGLYASQQTVTSLLIERHRQLATLSAARISEAVEGYIRVLEALAETPEIQSDSSSVQLSKLQSVSDTLEIFNAGVVITNEEGRVTTGIPAPALPITHIVAEQNYFRQIRAQGTPSLSDVIPDALNNRSIIVMAVPIVNKQRTFRGALLGMVSLSNTSLGDAVRQLRFGKEDFSYVVDGQGRVIFHPLPENIGADFNDRPFVKNVVAGDSGGTLWKSSTTGEQLVMGYAPIKGTHWGLIVREQWDAVVAPVQVYSVLAGCMGLAAILASIYLLRRGVRRIAKPLHLLAEQSTRLAAGESVEPIRESEIAEIKDLESSFNQMAFQIASYRSGLRLYVEAMTHLQEEERKRLARELHDETTQSLLAIARRLELMQSSEDDHLRQSRLSELQKMISDTLRGVREISRDLRPLLLEDLGLVPALQALVRSAREGEGAIPHTQFKIRGEPAKLNVEQELALYRITQEALSNIRKHARATGIEIELSFDAAKVQLEIRDDGQGFIVPHSLTELAQRGSFGLVGIQERIWAVGGQMMIRSTPGRGTQLSVTMPVTFPTS